MSLLATVPLMLTRIRPPFWVLLTVLLATAQVIAHRANYQAVR